MFWRRDSGSDMTTSNSSSQHGLMPFARSGCVPGQRPSRRPMAGRRPRLENGGFHPADSGQPGKFCPGCGERPARPVRLRRRAHFRPGREIRGVLARPCAFSARSDETRHQFGWISGSDPAFRSSGASGRSGPERHAECLRVCRPRRMAGASARSPVWPMGNAVRGDARDGPAGVQRIGKNGLFPVHRHPVGQRQESRVRPSGRVVSGRQVAGARAWGNHRRRSGGQRRRKQGQLSPGHSRTAWNRGRIGVRICRAASQRQGRLRLPGP